MRHAVTLWQGPLAGLVFAAILFLGVETAHAGFTQLDVPGATKTVVYGVSGGNVVGEWEDTTGVRRGFVYDGASYTTIDHPDSEILINAKTVAFGIDGNTAVGAYFAAGAFYGFRYDVPTGNFTSTDEHRGYYSIEGSTIVGGLTDSFGPIRGFIDNGVSSTEVTHPDDVGGTFLYGYSAGRAVGDYYDADHGVHGFIFDSGVFTPLAYPTGDFSNVSNISGSMIVGFYRDDTLRLQGFIYNGSTFTSFAYPSANHTRIYDIDGNSIVGSFTDILGQTHGFIAQVPEPSTFCLGAVAVLAVVLARSLARRMN